MSDDDLYMKFNNCLILNTIRTARTLTRRYDSRLRPLGVTVIQFSVMGLIRKHENMTINALSEQIAMDRTTLTRNLDVLVRKGLVVKAQGVKGNTKVCRLTDEGNSVLDQIIPVWLQTREELRTALKGYDPDAYLSALRKLAED